MVAVHRPVSLAVMPLSTVLVLPDAVGSVALSGHGRVLAVTVKVMLFSLQVFQVALLMVPTWIDGPPVWVPLATVAVAAADVHVSLVPVVLSVSVGDVAVAVTAPVELLPLTVAVLTDAKAGAAARPTAAMSAAPVTAVPAAAFENVRMGWSFP